MKTLLVRYTPRNEISKSKMLLDAFRQEITDSEIEELDLCSDVPDLINPDMLSAIFARNIFDKIPLDSPVKVLEKIDRMTAQLKSADVVVIAFPMYNFSMPATVKAWFDTVMLARETLQTGKRGFYGLMGGKKALALVTAGGLFNSVNPQSRGSFDPTWEHALSLAKVEFLRMGYSDIRGVLAEGLVVNAMKAEIIERTMTVAIEGIRAIAREWYGQKSTNMSTEAASSQIVAGVSAR